MSFILRTQIVILIAFLAVESHTQDRQGRNSDNMCNMWKVVPAVPFAFSSGAKGDDTTLTWWWHTGLSQCFHHGSEDKRGKVCWQTQSCQWWPLFLHSRTNSTNRYLNIALRLNLNGHIGPVIWPIFYQFAFVLLSGRFCGYCHWNKWGKKKSRFK